VRRCVHRGRTGRANSKGKWQKSNGKWWGWRRARFFAPLSKIKWGWKRDPKQEFHPWLLYADLPQGQVSFHSAICFGGPDYAGEWDGQKLSAERIVAFCEGLRRGDLKFQIADLKATQPGVAVLPEAECTTRKIEPAADRKSGAPMSGLLFCTPGEPDR
jgi:hypothetical protein